MDTVETKKSICTSRSFAETLSDEESMRSTVASFASMCAFKLRKQSTVANIVSVFVMTNRFDEKSPQYSNIGTVTMPVSASNQIEIVLAAQKALKSIFIPGIKYKKAGVVVSGITPDRAVQQALFDTNVVRREKMDKVSSVVDSINSRGGMDTIHLASQELLARKESRPEDSQKQVANKNMFLNNLRREHISPRYSTCIDEILKVSTLTRRDVRL